LHRNDWKVIRHKKMNVKLQGSANMSINLPPRNKLLNRVQKCVSYPMYQALKFALKWVNYSLTQNPEGSSGGTPLFQNMPTIRSQISQINSSYGAFKVYRKKASRKKCSCHRRRDWAGQRGIETIHQILTITSS